MKHKVGDRVELIWYEVIREVIIIEELPKGEYVVEFVHDGERETIHEAGIMETGTITKLASEELVKLPTYMEDWLEFGDRQGYDLVDLFNYYNSNMSKEVEEWILNSETNQYKLAMAWLCGYVVEEEEL
ncbi:DUF1642 domain protein [Listeria phage LP-KV022]|uniref:DUF1642 domain protein n=2 Tax=Homburgvirus LP110 TaxID=1921128 RepID=A0A5A4K4S1_9CAUD|nr:DUF1642 domain protein [Listeria phage LP-110]AGI11533.1 DUF1642 domain protein [Listeria phage LP-110]AWY07724.1 DUF1642 domain protein [Listeria phage LP-KV022]